MVNSHVHRLPQRDNLPHGLGRHVQHDPRSLEFPARRGTRPTGTVYWSMNGPLVDQGDVGRCTGYSLVNLCNTGTYFGERRKFNRGHFLNGSHGDQFYHRATQLDEWDGVWPPDDTGSSGLAVAKGAKELGLISEYRHAFGIDHLLDALVLGPALVGTTWLEDMFYPAANGELSVTGDPAGGHEYLCNYVDFKRERLGFVQTWGPWGYRNQGRFFIPIEKFEPLLDDDGDVTVLVGAVA